MEMHKIKARLDKIVANRAYSTDDLHFFASLYGDGAEDAKKTIRQALDVPSVYDMQNY